MSISDAGPMNPEDLETARMWLAKGTSLTLGLGMELLEAHDYYRARCPVLASDMGPKHTTRRTWDYLAANGWSMSDNKRWLTHSKSNTPEHNHPISKADIPAWCGVHAQASGMTPLDVLAAIGAMP